MDHTDTATAADAVTHVLRNAFADLRKMYPFMNTDGIKTALDDVSRQLKGKIHELYVTHFSRLPSASRRC